MHVDTMPGHTFDYDAWENAAWEALLLLDKYLKTDQNDMTRLHGNISLLFTPSVGIHFVHWNDKQTRRGILFLFCLHVYNRSSNTQGQMVLLNSENRVMHLVFVLFTCLQQKQQHTRPNGFTRQRESSHQHCEPHADSQATALHCCRQRLHYYCQRRTSTDGANEGFEAHSSTRGPRHAIL